MCKSSDYNNLREMQSNIVDQTMGVFPVLSNAIFYRSFFFLLKHSISSKDEDPNIT